MNIDEERKAFEIAFQVSPYLEFDANEGVYTTRAPNGTWLYNSCAAMNIRMQGWRAAKAHAEEMAKPPCVIELWAKYQTWSVKKPKGQAFRNIRLEFATPEEAKVWATANGYRVIE